ncbi:MAG TPA: hypothetical protein VHA73_15790 [Acidimicrobiales bacterium]|nr:hypothetical protein [Acidimicrobiales bacterium]
MTVLRPLDDQRSLQLGGLLDEICDAGSPAVLDLRLASPPPFEAWLVIERCRKRFAHAGTSLRLITGTAGYSDERRAAQHCLEQLRTDNS